MHYTQFTCTISQPSHAYMTITYIVYIDQRMKIDGEGKEEWETKTKLKIKTKS